MGKKQAERKRKSRPPESPLRVSSDSFSLSEETSGTSAGMAEPMTSPKKPAPFKRVWSEESELGLLNSLLQFERQKRNDLSIDSSKDRYDFVTECLAGHFTRLQVKDKLNRLKRKFLDGKLSSSSPNPHERKICKLSAKIWSQSDAALAHPNIRPKSQSDSPPVDADIGSKGQRDAMDSDMGSEERVRNSDLDFEKFDVGAVSDLLGKAVEQMGQVRMDKRLQKLKKEVQIAELELFLKKGELLKRQLTRVLERSGT